MHTQLSLKALQKQIKHIILYSIEKFIKIQSALQFKQKLNQSLNKTTFIDSIVLDTTFYYSFVEAKLN